MATAQDNTEKGGKLLPGEYEERIFSAVCGLRTLRKIFTDKDADLILDTGEQEGIAWTLGQVIRELEETALNCENVRRM